MALPVIAPCSPFVSLTEMTGKETFLIHQIIKLDRTPEIVQLNLPGKLQYNKTIKVFQGRKAVFPVYLAVGKVFLCQSHFPASV